MKDGKHPSGLTKYVGYAAIREAFGVAPRTVQDMVRKGEFPQPVRLPGRVGGPASFRVDEVTAWDQARQTHRRTHLQALAVTNPSDLAPDELEDKARDLAAEALSKRTGKPVDPLAVSLHLTQQLTAEEFVELQRKEHRLRAAALRQLSANDAAVVAAALLPTLTPVLARGLPEFNALFDDGDGLEVPFKNVSDFLTLLELATRLLDEEPRLPGDATALEHLAKLDLQRAMLVAVCLFPSIREIIVPGHEADQQVFADDDLLHTFAVAALNDARWPEAEAQLRARREAHEKSAPH